MLAVAAVAWLIWGGGGDEEDARDTAAPAIVEAVVFDQQRARVESVGTARARRSVMLHAAASGEVEKVLFQPGDRVAAGAPLDELDSRQERLAVERAEVELRNSRQLLARYERIRNTGAVSESQIDEIRAALDTATVALKQARATLEDRTVRAPFDGHVGITDVDPGDRIDAATEIAPFDDRGVVFVDFKVPEAFIGRIGPGTPIVAEPWTAGGAPEQGEVRIVDTRIDPVERNVTVRAAIDNADDSIRPGMSFRVTIDLRGKPYPLVAEASILWGGEGSYLWVVRGGKASRISAVIVERREGAVLVDAALQAGDAVVVEGVQRMREGMPVEIVKASAPKSLEATQSEQGP
ncbi:MAG: efflux RND transporter periplasmic adaptor subunit [Sphingomonadales bacterium]